MCPSVAFLVCGGDPVILCRPDEAIRIPIITRHWQSMRNSPDFTPHTAQRERWEGSVQCARGASCVWATILVTLRINDRSHMRACEWAGRERYMKIGLGWLLHITSDDSITVVIYIYAFLLCACGMELSFTSQRMQRMTSRSRGHVKRMLLPEPAELHGRERPSGRTIRCRIRGSKGGRTRRRRRRC